MVKVLFDTNILIDYLNGVQVAKLELERFENRAISVVTWMEVMVGATHGNQDLTRAFLEDFDHLELNAAVAERAVLLRRGRRIKLPDAIIWATAQVNDRLLVTRNTKDFAPDEPGVRVPYLS